MNIKKPAQAKLGRGTPSFCAPPSVSEANLNKENPKAPRQPNLLFYSRGCPILTAFFALRVKSLTLVSNLGHLRLTKSKKHCVRSDLD